MADISLLYTGLAQYHIEQPQRPKQSGGFMRWGKDNRYWAKDIGEGFIFGDYVSGISESIFPQRPTALTPEEIRKRRALIEKERQQAKEEQIRLWKDKATEALNIWQHLPAFSGQHSYLNRKQVLSYGLRMERASNRLVIPMRDTSGKIWSLQYINETGEKRFLSGGRVKGCYLAIGRPDKEIVICEGYATGASIHQATGKAVAVAFNKGNLESVVKALKNKYPALELIIAADNDIKENAPNVGVAEANRIALLYGCKVIIPSLSSGGKCDFNDIAVNEGLEQVKALFNGKITASDEANKYPLPAGYCLTDKHLLYTGGDGDPVTVSSRIEVFAKTRDDNSQNWGKLLSFKDPDGNQKQIAIPNTMFAADCRELRERLLSEGLEITPAGKSKLSTYLMSCNPTARALCINKTGWYNGVYVLPDAIIGQNNESISFQVESFNNVYTCKGSAVEWRENIGKYCQDNSRLIFAVSTAFAAALLELTGLESGGLHFVGGSSCGKSTILRVAASVWGGKDYLRTWRTTDNGLEGIANMHNDSLLVLDELGQVDAAKAGEIAYMLGNGSGKTRANRNGTAKNTYSWRLLFLSSGEKDLNDCAEESKKKVKAGQEIRLLNIPAKPSGNSFGAFEYLHHFADGGKFAEYLNKTTKEYYGTPAREFIKSLTKETSQDLKTWVNKSLGDIKMEFTEAVKELCGNVDTQVGRAINRFALVALAGEYATEKGLTGWEQGNTLKAAAICFKDWLSVRGGSGNQEDKAILEQVKYFFEQNSESRFYDLTTNKNDKIINMAGYKDKTLDEWEYYVLPTVFKKDICSGFNMNLAREILTKNGWMTNREAVQKKLRGENKRVYIFNNKLWRD